MRLPRSQVILGFKYFHGWFMAQIRDVFAQEPGFHNFDFLSLDSRENSHYETSTHSFQYILQFGDDNDH
jgi:hypothetical protein